MHLYGMLDSPYVRRVAVALNLLGISYEHTKLSVFSTFDEFRAVNPVVKAPTLVTDDGVTLMDSTLILEHVEEIGRRDGATLRAASPADRTRALRITGLALAAAEKAVQIVYEHNLRPAAKLHQPWVDRVTGQLHAALAGLEEIVGAGDRWLVDERPLEVDATVAVVWDFIRMMIPDVVAADAYPGLAHFSTRAEALPAFAAAPSH
ncbi:glutathione S-transferase family protein [Acuticoccus mangrovi]|uniref:Glutathione S-transferase n=1 Tax=Acuticoccus mangrovi TaxID=2796142 RepID=A0A934IQA4_9HYPH|nr:glutathione S-transferase [Acuticoccus mangrovi]MBJ3776648.1 glutathione S-transferase [Acuticoccus mangrovi]